MINASESGGHPVKSTAPRSEGAAKPSRPQPLPLNERAAFSPAEFAALCGRSPTWAYRQIYAGRVKPISGCGRLLIPRSEVDSFLGRKAEYGQVKWGCPMRSAQNANARRQPGERASKLTNRARLRRSPRDVNGTYGLPELCAWKVAPGLFRFQTDSPDVARKLSKGSKARLVGWGVNAFLRIYQEPMSRRQAISLVDRYLMSANSAFFDLKRSPSRQKSRGSITTARRLR